MKREFSAGGAVYRKLRIRPFDSTFTVLSVNARGKNEEFRIEWLVAKHSGYKKWVLPKGLIDPGEKSEKTAVREVKEETGVEAKITGKIQPAEKYVYTFNGEKIFKVVQYYLMEYVSGDVADHDWEMEEVEWLLFYEAKKRLEFSGQKKVLEAAREMVK